MLLLTIAFALVAIGVSPMRVRLHQNSTGLNSTSTYNPIVSPGFYADDTSVDTNAYTDPFNYTDPYVFTTPFNLSSDNGTDSENNTIPDTFVDLYNYTGMSL